MSTPARIVLAGGTGFLGAPLARAFAANGADVTILTRGTGHGRPSDGGTGPFRPGAQAGPERAGPTSGTRTVTWAPDGTVGPWAAALEEADAVVNLAGESIGSGRWTARRKAEIVDSRIRATRSLANAIGNAHVPPRVFVSASGINYYGPHGDEVLTEQTPPGDDFMARLAVAWEAEAERAASARTRVVLTRSGLVIAADGGALAPMLLPFRLGLGGPMGSGRQYWSWIHRADWLAMVLWAIAREDIDGALNVTSPEPVTNAEFVRTLARALRRPAIFPLPAFAARLMLGEMADALILTGQRAVPDKARRGGFTFQYARLDDALAAIFGR